MLFRSITAVAILGVIASVNSYEVFVRQSTPHYKYQIFGGKGQNINEHEQFYTPISNNFETFGGVLAHSHEYTPVGSSPNLYHQPNAFFSEADNNPNRCGIQAAYCDPKSRYRTYDGTCNNLENPSWGTPNSSYTRLLPPRYADGIQSPTDVGHQAFPLPRVLSLVLFPDEEHKDKKFTLATMQFGQIVTHDIAMIAGSTQAKKHKTQCCTNDGQLLDRKFMHYHCYPMIIPNDDPLFSKDSRKCINFVRTITDRDRNCVPEHKPAEQLTQVTSFLDAHVLYGLSVEQNARLREFRGGRMLAEHKHGREFLPSAQNKTASCDVGSEFESCFMAGDARANQNPQLTILHTIMLREHNRVANYLSHLNPHWDDETIFQEARRIVIAEFQRITYYEWLPLIMGAKPMIDSHVLYHTNGFVNDYDKHVNPAIINSHSTAAFRYFHTAIAGHLELVTPKRNIRGALRLSDWFNRPGIIEADSNFDDLSRGLCSQPEEEIDQFHTSEITQYLFREGRRFGSDLRAIDIQRGRDHGLASYNDFRELCGLPKAKRFEDFLDLLSEEHVEKLSSLYNSPDDVDISVGGSLETHNPGTLVGPTFTCIMAEQFRRLRKGDRYFFENGDHVTGFTAEQLGELNKATISRWFCDNGDHIKEMQMRGFEVISKTNPVVDCSILPTVNLDFWKDISVGPSNEYSVYGFKK